jgi:hypothetical protein
MARAANRIPRMRERTRIPMKELERLGIVYPQALKLYTILAKNSE